MICDVAMPLPVRRAFSYRVPEALRDRVKPGVRVVAPLRKRPTVGLVLEVREGDDEGLASLLDLPDADAAVTAELLRFLRELAAYYFAPIGEVIRLALPPMARGELAIDPQTSLFAKKGALRGEKLAPSPKEQVARATTDLSQEAAIRGRARTVLNHLRALGECPVSQLVAFDKNARAIVKRLVGLGAVEVIVRERAHPALFAETVARDAPPVLTEHQARAAFQIQGSVERQDRKAFLLFGVTGSGKTEVYLRAIERSLELEGGALVLVPEIALTPQLVSRFRARFGDHVAVIHSAQTARARANMHAELLAGRLRVAIGARSALFAPVPNLRLIIVDEEHDPSFKQEEGVRYQARDMALLRGHLAGATVVLGSATPSLESFVRASEKKLLRLDLPERAARTALLPKVTTVDLKRVGKGPGEERKLTLPLHRAIEETLGRSEQAILFLNRRGHSPAMVCGACGHLARCPSCSVALTFHQTPRRLGIARCHYCGYESGDVRTCQACKATDPALEGLGTEKLEEAIAALFPQARVARLDRDVADGKKAEAILQKVASREIDILVGTQMVAKGHDYPFVTLVGVINADAALGLPDYRASERAFQLLVQVAGRAGRHERAGKVLIQSYSPEHPAIRFAMKHDVEGFLEHEARERKETEYPPYGRLALVRVDAEDEEVARTYVARLAAMARDQALPNLAVLGPSPAPLSRLRGRYRFHFLLKTTDRAALRKVANAVANIIDADGERRCRSSVDIDPQSML